MIIPNRLISDFPGKNHQPACGTQPLLNFAYAVTSPNSWLTIKEAQVNFENIREHDGQ
jgi:hypothetical protein